MATIMPQPMRGMRAGLRVTISAPQLAMSDGLCHKIINPVRGHCLERTLKIPALIFRDAKSGARG